MKFMIIHGTYGNPHENWFSWLKEKLIQRGHKAYVPGFPTPEEQSLDNWKNIIEKYEIDEDCVLIGHSLGVAFILNILEEKKAYECFLVAGFISQLGDDRFDKLNSTFLGRLDFDKIKSNCHRFNLFHSDNDPYVNIFKADELARRLDIKPMLIENAGHFNSDSGYDEFHKLLDLILSRPYA